LEELKRVGLDKKVNVRVFKPDDEDRVRGCYTSHMAIMQEIQKKYKNKKNYKVLILEDNLEITLRMNPNVVDSISEFLEQKEDWDIFHLAYMMYVPGLNLNKLKNEDHIVQMFSDPGSSIGTTAYIISKSGVDSMIEYNKKNGYKEAIPNVMAASFPSSRYASYPMLFHRASKIGSLVNPQLDSFRKVMFNPLLYTLWETLMVSTGLQNNQLFPAITLGLFISTITLAYNAYQTLSSTLADPSSIFSTSSLTAEFDLLLVLFPLFVALWGASLFKPGNTGKGFAASTQKQNK
jgi:GR25 family glycosyltransferase involved in LPS biosynthesis